MSFPPFTSDVFWAAHCIVNHFISSFTVRMISSVTTLTFFVLWAAGVSQSVLITQWPHYISRLPSGSAEMSCYQNDTDYDYMYWYRQLRGGEIQLVGYLVAGSANYEAGFQSGFEAAKSQEKQWSLKIASVQREDEAVYLCAASLHSAVTDTSNGLQPCKRP